MSLSASTDIFRWRTVAIGYGMARKRNASHMNSPETIHYFDRKRIFASVIGGDKLYRYRRRKWWYWSFNGKTFVFSTFPQLRRRFRHSNQRRWPDNNNNAAIIFSGVVTPAWRVRCSHKRKKNGQFLPSKWINDYSLGRLLTTKRRNSFQFHFNIENSFAFFVSIVGDIY